MRTIKINEKEFNNALANCVEYANQSTDGNEKLGYATDIIKAIKAKAESGLRVAFFTLTGSGVFHDSEGKVVDIKDSEITIATEY